VKLRKCCVVRVAYAARMRGVAGRCSYCSWDEVAMSNSQNGCKALLSALRDVAGHAQRRMVPLSVEIGAPPPRVCRRPRPSGKRSKSVRRNATGQPPATNTRGAHSKGSPSAPGAATSSCPPAHHKSEADQSTMAETVFAMVQRQEKERREAIARGEPDPFLVKQEEEPAREPNRLEKFEEWMATDWEFGPYYWEEGQERPEQLKERLRQRFWWLYEKNLRGAEFVGEVVANLFGLTESKYQWVIDAQRDEERREKQRKLEDSQRRMLAERARQEREATEAAARREQGDVEH
jgi:hypothetical protein